MQIEAKDIESLLPEFKHVCGDFNGVSYREGFNACIEMLSKKKLEVVIDREKLALCIWTGRQFLAMNVCEEIADAIILKSKTDNGLVTIRSVE